MSADASGVAVPAIPSAATSWPPWAGGETDAAAAGKRQTPLLRYDAAIYVPSDNMQHIQETHLAVEHIFVISSNGRCATSTAPAVGVVETRNGFRRRASVWAFPRRAWERESINLLRCRGF